MAWSMRTLAKVTQTEASFCADVRSYETGGKGVAPMAEGEKRRAGEAGTMPWTASSRASQSAVLPVAAGRNEASTSEGETRHGSAVMTGGSDCGVVVID